MIEELKEEHAELRRLCAEVVAALGAEKGVGRDDLADVDMRRLAAAEEALSKSLDEHEKREKRLMKYALEHSGAEHPEFEAGIETAHRTLAHLVSLLKTVSTLCDGCHVYAVRNAVKNVADHLEAHLRHEEKVLFPFLESPVRR